MAATSHTVKLDFNGDGASDLLWRAADGTYALWFLSQDGQSIAGARLLPNPNPSAAESWELKLVTDINGDHVTDMVWQNSSGGIATWTFLPDGAIEGNYLTESRTQPLVASGDFNGDGRGEMLLQFPPSMQNPDGLWFSEATEARKIPAVGTGALDPISQDWRFQGVGDFNADGKTDMLFRGGGNATVGSFLIETINAASPGETGKMASTPVFFADPGTQWGVERLADFNHDGHTDIVWRAQDGTPAIWLMNNNQILTGILEPNPTSYWSLVDAQDFNGDGKADLLWRGAGGEVAQWFMDGGTIVGAGTTLPNPGNSWTLVGI